MKAIISFTIDSPRDCTEEQFLSWIKFSTGQIRCRKIDDLSNEDFPLDFISEIGDFEPEIDIVNI